MENNEEIKKDLIEKFQSLANILKSLNGMLQDKLDEYENKNIIINKNEDNKSNSEPNKETPSS